MITLITFIVNACLFAIVYIIKNRIHKLKHVEVLDEKKVRGALFILSLSVLVAGISWFLEKYLWINIVASLLSLTALSLFFNTTKIWFKKVRHFKRGDLLAAVIWLLWLLSGSIFLANILGVVFFNN